MCHDLFGICARVTFDCIFFLVLIEYVLCVGRVWSDSVFRIVCCRAVVWVVGGVRVRLASWIYEGS